MGVRRERENFSNVLHLDPRRRPSSPRRNTSHCISHWRYRYESCNQQPHCKSRTHLNNSPSWDRGCNVLRVLREDRPIWAPCLAPICIRGGTHSSQYDSSCCDDRNRWIRYRQNSHDDISASLPHFLSFLCRLGSHHHDLRKRNGSGAR